MNRVISFGLGGIKKVRCGLKGNGGLREAHIKQGKPVLQGLQSKSAKDESDAECPQPAFGKVVRVVFDARIERDSDGRDDAGDQTHANRKRPGVIQVMDEGATSKGRSNIADRTDHSSLKLAACQAWTARGR